MWQHLVGNRRFGSLSAVLPLKKNLSNWFSSAIFPHTSRVHVIYSRALRHLFSQKAFRSLFMLLVIWNSFSVSHVVAKRISCFLSRVEKSLFLWSINFHYVFVCCNGCFCCYLTNITSAIFASHLVSFNCIEMRKMHFDASHKIKKYFTSTHVQQLKLNCSCTFSIWLKLKVWTFFSWLLSSEICQEWRNVYKPRQLKTYFKGHHAWRLTNKLIISSHQA